MPYPIIARPSADYEAIFASLDARDASSLFMDHMLPALWRAGLDYGIDPVGMVAQSYKETKGGQFLRSDGTPGAVQPWMRNTAGIKVRDTTSVRKAIAVTAGMSVDQVSVDHPLCHHQNFSWEVGAIVQAQHLRAYCGLAFSQPVIDPRWEWVYGKHRCETWADLNGKWAGGTYGSDVEGYMDWLR